MKKYIIYIFLCQTLVAQNTRVLDSLRHLVSTAKNDSSKIIRMLYLSAEEATFDSDSAIKIANATLDFASKTKNQKGIASCYNQLGNLYSWSGDLIKALKFYEMSLEIRQKIGLPKDICVSYYTLGSIYVKLSDFKKGIEYCYKSLEISEKIKNEELISSTRGVIADALMRMGKLDDALKLQFQNLKLGEQNKDRKLQARVFGNIGLIYGDKKDTANALKFYKLQLDAAREIGNKGMEGTCLANTGSIFSQAKNYKMAIIYMLKSLEIKKEMGYKLGIAAIMGNLGSTYMEMGNLALAEKYGTEGLKVARETGDVDIESGILEILSEIYKKQGKFEKALECYAKHTALNDTIMNQEIENEVTRKSLKYEFEKKTFADSLNLIQVKQIKDAELAAKEFQLTRSRFLSYGLSGIAFLVFVIAALFIRQNKLKAEQQAIQLEQKLLRSQMNPHFIFNCLQAIQNFTLKNNGKEATFYLSAFGGLTRSVLENSRTELVSLKKEITLLEHYLNLQRLLNGEKFTYRINVSPDLDIEYVNIPPMLAQPFIENAIIHGMRGVNEGGVIEINFSLNEQNLLLEIKDNGVGMNISETKENNSLATSITKERIDLFNKRNKNKASFSISEAYPANMNKGVKVSFVLPLS